jgi:excisionase family DNA binding protein
MFYENYNLDKKQVSKMLECSIGKIDTAMRKNQLTYAKIGNKVRFKKEEVEQYVKEYMFKRFEAHPQTSTTIKREIKLNPPNGFDHWMGNLTKEEKSILLEKYMNN